MNSPFKVWFYNKSGEPLREEFHRLNKSLLLFRSLENPRSFLSNFVFCQISNYPNHSDPMFAPKLETSGPSLYLSFFSFFKCKFRFCKCDTVVARCLGSVCQAKDRDIYHINIYNFNHINIIICTLKTLFILRLSV